MASREDIRNFCKWYLENVESPARANKMKCYAIENNSVQHANRLTTKSVSRALTVNKEFKCVKRGYWVIS